MRRQHPLKVLRENSGLCQAEIAQRAGLSQTKLSLVENDFASLTLEEEGRVRRGIVEGIAERAGSVFAAADPRLALALKEIESSPSKKKVFEMLQESRGYSQLEAAIATLGRNYPGQRF